MQLVKGKQRDTRNGKMLSETQKISRDILGSKFLNPIPFNQSVVMGMSHLHGTIHKAAYLLNNGRADVAMEMLEQCREPLELIINKLQESSAVNK